MQSDAQASNYYTHWQMIGCHFGFSTHVFGFQASFTWHKKKKEEKEWRIPYDLHARPMDFFLSMIFMAYE